MSSTFTNVHERGSPKFVEKCFGHKMLSHVVGFRGCVSCKDLKGPSSKKVSWKARLHLTQEGNRGMKNPENRGMKNPENRGMKNRPSAPEDYLQKIREMLQGQGSKD
ncbi:unnamed protein product [Cuscuta epithymum]|uniref:Uncharacterized protein n=1 Tax=Cuscuta epithymum TaxID=186058 RepID=A0AAV0FLB6_9ASTE|nr:unnamed protein product [Cuscuta epithymum]CAH9136326.1 unnamed protein product [Cuscuta epithymum]